MTKTRQGSARWVLVTDQVGRVATARRQGQQFVIDLLGMAVRGEVPASRKTRRNCARTKELRRRDSVQTWSTRMRRVLGSIWFWVVVLMTVVGFAGEFLPRVTIAPPSDPVDPANPFSTSFTVTNSGIPTLDDVEIRVVPGEIVGSSLPFNPHDKFVVGGAGYITRPEWQHHTLKRDEPFTITLTHTLGLAPGAYLGGADLAIMASYRPWFWPFHQQSAFRFRATRQTNGQFYWYSVPLD